ncbi:MAG: hypothetical protein WAO83_00525 [Fuerstiella sp.]
MIHIKAGSVVLTSEYDKPVDALSHLFSNSFWSQNENPTLRQRDFPKVDHHTSPARRFRPADSKAAKLQQFPELRP